MAARPRLAPAAAACALLAALAASAAGQVGQVDQAPPVLDAETLRALSDYVNNPGANRGRVLDLAKQSDALPAPALLAVADAQLRAGRLGDAGRLFHRVLELHPGRPYEGYAELGLGFTTLGMGDQRIIDGGEIDPLMARVMVGLLDANPDAIDTLARESATPVALRPGIELSAAYARYWRGDYLRASVAFAAVAEANPTGPLADDARYGAAWSALLGGERDAAISALRDLAADDGDAPTPRASPALVSLLRSALLREAFRGYRRVPPRSPEDLNVAMFDHDGAALARAALHRLHLTGRPTDDPPTATQVSALVTADRQREEAKRPVPPRTDPMPAADATPIAARREEPRPARPAPPPPVPSPERRTTYDGWSVLLLAGVAAAAIAMLLALGTRGATRR
jgi:tetratricopeptide (TPR) repeat protein